MYSLRYCHSTLLFGCGYDAIWKCPCLLTESGQCIIAICLKISSLSIVMWLWCDCDYKHKWVYTHVRSSSMPGPGPGQVWLWGQWQCPQSAPMWWGDHGARVRLRWGHGAQIQPQLPRTASPVHGALHIIVSEANIHLFFATVTMSQST